MSAARWRTTTGETDRELAARLRGLRHDLCCMPLLFLPRGGEGHPAGYAVRVLGERIRDLGNALILHADQLDLDAGTQTGAQPPDRGL
jgi:hypothetical protein